MGKKKQESEPPSLFDNLDLFTTEQTQAATENKKGAIDSNEPSKVVSAASPNPA